MFEPARMMLTAVVLKMALYFAGEIDTVVAGPVVHEDKITFVDDVDPNQQNQQTHDDEKMERWETSGHFEGDMVLTTHQRNGILDESSRWPNNTIPYELDPIFDYAEQEFIKSSLSVYQELTCLIVREKEPEDKDYIYVTGENTGCWSNVGFQGGRQELNLERKELGKGCFRNGTIVHEFLHAAGFYHQQSSPDRDKYIRIIWENIKPGTEANFNKLPFADATTFNATYDYQSIMHYGQYAFSANDKRTIVPLDSDVEMGQRTHLSEIDLFKIQQMYCPDEEIDNDDYNSTDTEY